ncbi:lactate utilization protein C [Piscinibacter sp.]|uniref:LutC/YkgG family protein n=1 Tax=Piscinibacter sp. TaxID=1903157 RepID=UPI00355A0EA1
MTSREQILSRVRQNQPAPVALPEVPRFDRELPSLLDTFRAALLRMGGSLVEAPPDGDLDELIRGRFAGALVICSATPEVRGNRPIAGVRSPTELEDVDVGVVRAGFGVAETGSVWLSEAQFKINALGFLSQHLVVLLDPRDIVPNLHHAYWQHGFFEARYAVLMTGPSATADIEGVLVRGAQGIRSLTVITATR